AERIQLSGSQTRNLCDLWHERFPFLINVSLVNFADIQVSWYSNASVMLKRGKRPGSILLEMRGDEVACRDAAHQFLGAQKFVCAKYQ
ncbi:MAG TPA: hypothetical protein VHD63_20995, partial [Ktedonobacteraceae bacterium]|nr:hypothetical protein [Ktedonobacteraceae bacterium]